MVCAISIRERAIPIRYCASRNSLGSSDQQGFLDGIRYYMLYIYNFPPPPPAPAPQHLPFTLFNRLAADLYTRSTDVLILYLNPPAQAPHDTNSGCNCNISCWETEVTELGAAGRTFLRPSREYLQCSKTYHVSAHQIFSIKFGTWGRRW